MNKTVSINLGGLFFHIDEDAYQKLNRYFDAIKRSLSPDGKDEIMNDIESRIAELLSENLKSDKQVVSFREVDEIIAIMGQPEDYRIDEETTQQGQNYYPPGYNPVRTKKFYRDGDKAIISGVCAGIGHYFRIDPLWIRILFIISLFVSFGTSIFIYILLWILIPKAITTTEKLEMTGEPINISNIEKKVKEEIDVVTGRLQNIDYDKFGNTVGNGAEKVGNAIARVFMAIFKVLAKIIGAIITIFSALTLGGLVIGCIVLLFSTGFNDTPWFEYADMGNYTGIPIWLLAILGLLAIGIPFFFLFLLGLKILVDNLRPVGTITKYTLLAIWLFAIALAIFLGVRQASQIGYEGKTVQKEQLAFAGDILHIKFRYNDYFSKSIDHNTSYRITQDAAKNDVIYSNNIALHIMKTDEAMPYLQIERFANGSSSSEARDIAEKIKYSFELQGDVLFLDNYLVTDIRNKYRHQQVKVYLYLPEGTVFMPDDSVEMYDETDNSFFDLWWDGEYTYKVDKDRINCVDCPPKDDESGEPVQDEDQIEYRVKDTITVNGAIQIVRDSIRFKERRIN